MLPQTVVERPSLCSMMYLYNVHVKGRYMAVWRRGVGGNYEYDTRLVQCSSVEAIAIPFYYSYLFLPCRVTYKEPTV